VAKEIAEVANDLKRVRLDAEEEVLAVRLKSLSVELKAKTVEKSLLVRTAATREEELTRGQTRLHELRGGDAAASAPKRARR
jgi:circadian clock protein KaiC